MLRMRPVGVRIFARNAFESERAGGAIRALPLESPSVASPIANILHHETIQRLSGDGAFARGKKYFLEGRVEELTRRDGAVHAKVRGTESYAVRIWMRDESLAYSCSCPQGQEQAFCKHAVAVALASTGVPSPSDTKEALGDSKAELSPTPPPSVPASRPRLLSDAPQALDSARPRPTRSLVETLRALSHEELVVIVLEAALDDDVLRRRLVLRLKSGG